MIKKWLTGLFTNPFDQLLKKASAENASRFLIVWNRGMGDVPLGLYALVHRIRTFIPNASITFLTRSDLADTFKMLEGIQVLVAEDWKRGNQYDTGQSLKEHNLALNMFDVVLEKPDPTRWLKWQLGTLVPKLKWCDEWDALVDRFDLDPNETYIGAHVNTETGGYYGYEKNWDVSCWQKLFNLVQKENKGKILLFGMEKEPAFLMDGVIDLRGETSLFDMLSLVKNRCRYLVAPDSGVLSLVYYLNATYPLTLVSLWADPRQGVLKQNVASPNYELEHTPLIGENDNVSNISVDAVYNALFSKSHE